jgi:hypothetical protein
MTLFPTGPVAAFGKQALLAAENANPVPVEHQEHEGSTFIVTFRGGSAVRIRHMHALH